MKKYFLIAALATLATRSYANEIKYCELAVYQPSFKRYVADVNYMGSHKRKFDKIKDANGKAIKFEARLDAVNYMIKDGWEVVSETIVPHSGGETRFYMKKAG